MKSTNKLFSLVKANAIYLIGYSIIFLTYILLLPKTGHGWDTYCWKEWTKFIFTNGFGNVYKSGTDYLPLYHYILYFFGSFQGSLVNIENNIYQLKVITLVADFVGGFFLIKLIKERISSTNKQFIYSLFFFLNAAILYNTLIWGQVDGILTTLLFISIFFAIKEKITLSLLFFVLAINMKLQAIIFMPIIGLMLLPLMIRKVNLKNLAIWVGSTFAIQILILLPFIIKGDIGSVFNVILNSFGKYPVVSMNAYNFWFWFLKGDLMHIPDNTLFAGITYKSWGLILFFTSSFIAIYPLLKIAYNKIIKKAQESLSTEKIMLISALIPLLFFFFNTQMHERYSHPALIFAITYSILSKNFFPSIIICSAYLLNMEDVLHYLQLDNYNSFIFKRHLIAIIYAIGIILLYASLFEVRLNLKSLLRSKS